MRRKVLITGASGFLGSAVLRALGTGAMELAELRLLAHRRPISCGAKVRVVRGNLADRESLRHLCDGIDTVLHLASEVGSDDATCRVVNTDGTRNLLREARRAGVRHFVYVSTAAVHGHGPHVAVDERRPPAPRSPASRSRLAAEVMVLAEDGVVLRPFLVYGDGDRWFVPALLRWLVDTPSAWVNGGRGRQSVISVDDLARAVVAVAERPHAFAGVGPFHVCEPEPIAVRSIVAELVRLFAVREPWISIPYGAFRAMPPLTRAMSDLRRRAERLGLDHWYLSDRFWARAGIVPGAPLPNRLPSYQQWYRQFLRKDRS